MTNDDGQVQGLLAAFRVAHDAGDIAQLQALFDRPSARADTRLLMSDYRRLFARSRQRRLELDGVSWFHQDGALTVIASYRSTVWPSGAEEPMATRGDMRFDLSFSQGRWRIRRLSFDAFPG